jgi:hypothetical protein
MRFNPLAGQRLADYHRLMKPTRELIIREDGALVASGKVVSELLADHAGRYRIVLGPPGVLVLERCDGIRRSELRSRVLMTGEIVGQTTVLELVSMIMHNAWRGELSLLESPTRRLMFDQGALKAAQSELASERLGEVMEALGVITSEQLAQVANTPNKSPDRRFGETAVERGFLEPQQLFASLQAQAERIFQASILVTQGSYVFALPAEDAEAPPTTLHLPVQGLLLEAVQRIDEMAYFRERIPNGELRPVLTDAALDRVSPSLLPVAQLSDGNHSILQIGRELRMGEFEVTKKVMQLLQTGCVELQAQQSMGEGVTRIVSQLNAMLREIRDTVERHGGQKGVRQMSWTLQTWAEETDLSQHFGSGFNFQDDIDPEACLRHLADEAVARPLETLHRNAHELISFAMFCASPALPREAERALSKWVNQRLARMRV